MSGFSSYLAASFVAYSVGKTAMPTLPTVYVGLFTAAPNDDGTGGTEVAGGGYARVATSGATWGAATSDALGTHIANAAAIAFPASSGAWGSIVAWGLFDAPTGGHLLDWDWIGSSGWIPWTCNIASPAVLTSPGSSLSNGNKVVLSYAFGGTVPSGGLAANTALTVAGATADTFNVGQAASETGCGMFALVQPMVVGSAGITLSFPIGDLTVGMV